MAALMLVAVMAFVVAMLVSMDRGLVAVLRAVMAVDCGLVDMFMLMFVFAVATHKWFS